MNPKAFVRHLLLFALLFVHLIIPCSAFSQSSPLPLKFAIIPHRSHLGNQQSYSRVISALEEETGFTFLWIGSESYDDVIEKLNTGQADVGYLGAFSYVKARDAFGVKILARTIDKDGMEFYRSMIITRKNSDIDSLADLKGKRFAFTDRNSTSGFLFPMAELKRSGIDPADFSEISFVKRHANSLLAVWYNHSDAGATASTIRNRIDIDFNQIRILWKSQPIYRGPWVARKELPDAVFQTVQRALFKLADRKDRERIFMELQTHGFVEGCDSDYDNVRETIRWMGDVKSAQ